MLKKHCSLHLPTAITTLPCNQGEGRRDSERRGRSGFSAALYPNPGFGDGMRRTQVRTNTSNNSTDMGWVGGGERLRGPHRSGEGWLVVGRWGINTCSTQGLKKLKGFDRHWLTCIKNRDKETGTCRIEAFKRESQ